MPEVARWTVVTVNEETPQPVITFADGHTIPQLGFGVWQASQEDAESSVREAIAVGYRSIDTARIYNNEEGTGRGIVAGCEAAGISRDDLFITTKVWNDDQGYDSTLRAFDASMDRLSLDYLDLYLIHWPVAKRGAFVDTFTAMQKLRDEQRVRSIGVCNFTIDNLATLIDATGEAPALNQIELHPGFSQPELRAEHARLSIATEAWSPLGQGGDILADPVITSIASTHSKTPAQVILRWHLQLGNIVIPKSVTPSRIAENFDVFDFELSDDEVERIVSLDSADGRIGPDPDDFDL